MRDSFANVAERTRFSSLKKFLTAFVEGREDKVNRKTEGSTGNLVSIVCWHKGQDYLPQV